jgi:WD40 repeat protein
MNNYSNVPVDDVEEELDIEEDAEGGRDDDDGDAMAEEEVGDEDLEEAAPAMATVTDVDNSAATGTEHTGSVYCVAISGGTVLSGSGDDTGRLWSVTAGSEGLSLAPVAALTGHADSVVACAFSSTARRYAATAAYDATVRLWTKAGAPLHVLEGPSADVEWLAWHDKGDVLLAGSADATSWMWSVTDKVATCMQVFAGHEASVTCGTFAAEGNLVVTGSADRTVRVWEPKTGKLAMTFAG